MTHEWWVAIGASAIGAGWDVATRRIPNLLTGPVLLAGLVHAAWSGGFHGLMAGLAGCLMLAVPYVILFVFAGGGAGDAKLMGAVGAWLGFLDGAWVLFCVALSGVVLALGYAIARGKFQSLLAHLKQILFALSFLVSRRQSLDETRLMNPSKQDMLAMPYGVAILVGVIVAAGGKLLWPA